MHVTTMSIYQFDWYPQKNLLISNFIFDEPYNGFLYTIIDIIGRIETRRFYFDMYEEDGSVINYYYIGNNSMQAIVKKRGKK